MTRSYSLVATCGDYKIFFKFQPLHLVIFFCIDLAIENNQLCDVNVKKKIEGNRLGFMELEMEQLRATFMKIGYTVGRLKRHIIYNVNLLQKLLTNPQFY